MQDIRFPFLMVFLILMSFSVRPQGSKFRGFIHGGITASQISGDGAYGFVQFGAYAGPGIQMNLSERWNLAYSLVFNQKGSRIYKSSNSINTYRLRVNYAESPFLVGYEYRKINFAAGPYLGVKINQRESTQFGIVEDPRIFNRFDFGAQFQVAYPLTEKIRVNLAYQNSLIPVRAHASQLAYPPSNFILGDWHRKLLDKGQYFSLLTLYFSYSLGN
ncbi:MAG: porin family protein [Brumimicrobium sp.]|nr:porin family protein [Brumimicrobium sp.]